MQKLRLLSSSGLVLGTLVNSIASPLTRSIPGDRMLYHPKYLSPWMSKKAEFLSMLYVYEKYSPPKKNFENCQKVGIFRGKYLFIDLDFGPKLDA